MRTIVLLCCAVVALGACQKSGEERMAELAVERATGGQVTIEKAGEQVTVKTEDGEVKMSTGASLVLPAAFPKDVYLPRNYTVQSVVESADVTIVALHAAGDIATMHDEASAGMKAQGWEPLMSMQADAENRMLVYQKENRTASMTLARDQDRVQFTVHVAEEKE